MIVFDLEWTQPFGQESMEEIIQIGAVRLLENGTVADEFQVLVCPKYYKKLNTRVSKLTGLKDATLREEGLPFRQALERFRSWIGGDCIFLTWGFDDIRILEDNILLHDGEPDWIQKWYNAQLIFNAQTDGSGAQKALSTAMQMMDIAPSRAAHDALGDAYHTALVCQRLRLADGIAAYEAAVQAHENGFHGAELPGCVQRAVFHGYADKTAALGAMSG